MSWARRDARTTSTGATLNANGCGIRLPLLNECSPTTLLMAMMGTSDVVYAWVMCLCLRIKLLSFCSRLCNTHFQHSLARAEFGNEASPRRRTRDFTHVFVQLQPTADSSLLGFQISLHHNQTRAKVIERCCHFQNRPFQGR